MIKLSYSPIIQSIYSYTPIQNFHSHLIPYLPLLPHRTSGTKPPAPALQTANIGGIYAGSGEPPKPNRFLFLHVSTPRPRGYRKILRISTRASIPSTRCLHP